MFMLCGKNGRGDHIANFGQATAEDTPGWQWQGGHGKRLACASRGSLLGKRLQVFRLWRVESKILSWSCFMGEADSGTFGYSG